MKWSSSFWLMLLCGSAFADDTQTSKPIAALQQTSGDCPAQLSVAYNANWLPYVSVPASAQPSLDNSANANDTAQSFAKAELAKAEPVNTEQSDNINDTISGTDIELLRQIVSAVGSQVVFQFVPETRALQQLKNGHVDLLFAASHTPVRAEYAWFSKPYRHEVNVLVVHQDLLQLYPELMDRVAFFQLAMRKLVGTYIPTGFYGDEFELLKQNAQVSKRSLFVFEAERRLELVLSKRADYAVVDQVATEYQWQHNQQPPPLLLLPFAVNRAAIHVMASKKTVSATCVARLDAAITKVVGSLVEK
jgi:polar amino acid transport system substrate-binding protein